MNTALIRGPFDASPPVPSARPVPAPPTNIPEITYADERLAAAQAHLEQVTARLDAAQKAAGEMRDRSNIAIRKRGAEGAVLAAEQKEFAAALLSDNGVEEIQRRVTDSKARFDALSGLCDALLKDAKRLEAELPRFHGPVNQARKGFEHAELSSLIRQYAAAIVPIIPLAREITARAPELRLNPGYLLDVKRPKVGNYFIHDDGSITFRLD